MRRATLCLIACLLIVGCETQALPTQTTLEIAQTVAFMTQNAPPVGFDQGVRFAPIDRNLETLPHWHTQLTVRFEGFLAGSTQPISGTLSAEIFSNQISGERRVVLRAEGDAFALAEGRNVEGVRLGNTFYFVDQNGTCSVVTDDPNRRRVAELRVGDLIGGVRFAQHTYGRKTARNMALWQYGFLPSDVDLPLITPTQGGTISVLSGDLWIVPSLNAVADYTLTLRLESALVPIFQGNKQLSGTLTITYSLLESGTLYNIAIPFGC
ncbi:MAG: hypothetical protein RML95_09215 [Anaerolineae bacterium]|nr:hypothetical protein [Anaerolineae bacterium]MDW8299504.1 hypothetical protein [Anaerolineae bacterium]